MRNLEKAEDQLSACCCVQEWREPHTPFEQGFKLKSFLRIYFVLAYFGVSYTYIR